MHNGSGQARLQFARFVFDRASRELYCDGSRVQLQEQPAQVLTALLDRPGDIITREDLRERLWSSDTFVDFDHGLNTAVKKTGGRSETRPTRRRSWKRCHGAATDSSPRCDCCPRRADALPQSRLRSSILHSPSRRRNQAGAGSRLWSARSPWRCSAACAWRARIAPGGGHHQVSRAFHDAAGGDALPGTHSGRRGCRISGDRARRRDHHAAGRHRARWASVRRRWWSDVRDPTADPAGLADGSGRGASPAGHDTTGGSDVSRDRAAGAGRWRGGVGQHLRRTSHRTAQAAGSARRAGGERPPDRAGRRTGRGSTSGTRTTRMPTTGTCAAGACCSTTPRPTCARRFSISSRRSSSIRIRAGPCRDRHGQRLVQRAVRAPGRGVSVGRSEPTRRRRGPSRWTARWRRRISPVRAPRARPSAAMTGRAVLIRTTDALALDPSLEFAHLARMRAYYHLGLFEAAVREGAAATRLNPGNSVEFERLDVAVLLFGGRVRAGRGTGPDPAPSHRRAGRTALPRSRALLHRRCGRRTHDARIDQARNDSGHPGAGLARVDRSRERTTHRGSPQARRDPGRLRGGSSRRVQRRRRVRAVGRGSAALDWLERAADSGFPCYPWFERDPSPRPDQRQPAVHPGYSRGFSRLTKEARRLQR